VEYVLSGRTRGPERLLLAVWLTLGLMSPPARAQEAGAEDPLERFRAVMEESSCGEWNSRPHRCEAKACAQAGRNGADPGAIALELAECWSKAEPKHKARASKALGLMAEFGNEAQRKVAYVRLAAQGARSGPSSFSHISCDTRCANPRVSPAGARPSIGASANARSESCACCARWTAPWCSWIRATAEPV